MTSRLVHNIHTLAALQILCAKIWDTESEMAQSIAMIVQQSFRPAARGLRNRRRHFFWEARELVMIWVGFDGQKW